MIQLKNIVPRSVKAIQVLLLQQSLLLAGLFSLHSNYYQHRGEYHYNELAPKLSKITYEIIDLKNDIARQNTLLYVRDIMMSRDTIDQKLYKIRRAQEELSELKTSQW